jgi:hypothetical protein
VLQAQEFQGYKTVQAGAFGHVYNAHPAANQLLHDAVVRNGLPDQAQACYGGSIGKSMKDMKLAISQKRCWRKIAIIFIDPVFWRTNGASWHKCLP